MMGAMEERSHRRDDDDIATLLKAMTLRELRSMPDLVTKQDLQQTEARIMSAISDFAAKQKQFNERQTAAINDLKGDVETMTGLIEQLQSTQGQITPEDQGILDELTTAAEAATAHAEAVAALHPPTPPQG